MKLSTRPRYALRAMIAIARSTNGSKPTSLQQVADTTHISRRYLEQLAIALKRARLLRGLSGKGGGYILARPAGEIKIGQIFEAAIGPVNIVECVAHPDQCLRAVFCECRTVYCLINQKINRVLNDISLADISDPEAMKRVSMELEGLENRPTV
ncbi:MAG: rrf2 family protein, putative transcriptional regulator [Deltaproteobacteria bacterium]|nr:rrf2 family protein, putative transcriptional regulator [Deltaproteobacteria bacterium]